MEQDIKAIKDIVASVLQLSEDKMMQVEYDEDLRKYGMGSIASIELIVALEEKYNIRINDEDLIVENVCTINKVIQLLEEA